MLLDVEAIRSRRVALRTTERQLGRRIGGSGQLVRRIEAGLSHEGLTLRTVNRLAKALGMPIAKLFPPPPQVADALAEPQGVAEGVEEDVARVGALLAELREPILLEVVASVLRLPMDRVASTLPALRDYLLSAGQTLSVSDGTVAIGATPTVVDMGALEKVRREGLARRRLGIQEARMLVRVARNEIPAGATLDRPRGMLLARLAETGAIELPAGQWRTSNPPRLSNAFRFSAMLPAQPPSSPQRQPASAPTDGPSIEPLETADLDVKIPIDGFSGER